MKSINLKSTVGIALFFVLGFLVTVSCKKEKSVFAVAEFSFSGNAAATLPVTVQFTNSSIGLSYTWDFGDGSSSVEDNPSHTYNQYGIYRVKLTARGTNNIDSLIVDIVIGGTLGQITALNCAAAQVNRTIKTGDVLNQHPVLVPYTGGNGGVYNGQTVPSTGVSGLTATLTAGSFVNGSGNLEYKLTGTPQSFGQAKFNLNVGGIICEMSIAVLDSSDYIPRNGLIGWWPFNGNANDESGNGNNGIVTSAILTTNRLGVANSAYSFDFVGKTWASLNKEVFFPYSLAYNSANLTVSLWVLPRAFFWPGDSNNPNSTIIRRYQYGYSNPNGQVWGIDFNSTSLSGFVLSSNQTSAFVVYNTPFTLNEWYHVVMSYDGSELKLYLNGNVVSTTNTNLILNALGNSGISVGVSNQANGYWQDANAIIDDIGLWNRALSQQEVTMLYSASQ